MIISPLLAQKYIYFPKEALHIRKINIFKSLIILQALSSNVNFSLFKKTFGNELLLLSKLITLILTLD